MKRQRTNRIRRVFRPQVANLEARNMLSHSGLAPHAAAHARALVMSQPSAVSSGGTDVLTYHNETSRTGANLNETTLTPKNVNASSFGRLFRYTLDGNVFAQPLVVSNLSIGGKVHNVLIVATENDSVYALDANNPTAGPRHNGVLWQTSFIDPAKGITPVPSQDVQNTGISRSEERRVGKEC